MFAETYVDDCPCVLRCTSLFVFIHKIMLSYIKGALYRIWCGVNRLGDSGLKVV